MSAIRILILKNEDSRSHQLWLDACIKLKKEVVNYSIVDLTKNDWLENIRRFNPDVLLAKPGGLTSHFKQLYDERLTILVKELNYFVFPSLNEILIYENKRYFSYWLKAHHVPHPKTYVFYFKEEAYDFLNKSNYPIVGKVNIGASGSGVKIINDRASAIKYLDKTFTGRGASKRSGPDLNKGKLLKRSFHYLLNPRDIFFKLSIYRQRASDIQKHFVIFQEYIPHDFEWRVVRMGDSFFAHKKSKSGEKASGSLLKVYDNPPFSLLDFVKDLTDRFDFYSQAVDLFEHGDGYLVNEMQCIFGQSDPFQMLVDGIPGRYFRENEKWIFEPGDFNTNESFDLRLQTALELYHKSIK